MYTPQGGVEPLSILAAASFTGKRGYGVVISAANTVAVASSAGVPIFGILLDEPSAAGQAAAVAWCGKVQAKAGSGGFTAGDYVKVNASGLVVTASKAVVNTSDSGSATDYVIGSYVIGLAIETAAEGEFGYILLNHAGAVATTAV